MTYISSSIEIWEKSTQTHSCIVRLPRLALRLNSYLKHYPSSTRFDLTDEPKFDIPNDKLQEALNILGVKYASFS